MAESIQRDPFSEPDGGSVRPQWRGVSEPARVDKPCSEDLLPVWVHRHPIKKTDASSRSVSKAAQPPTRTGRSPLFLPKQMLTVAETASFLQVSEKTIRRMIARGALPVVRIGRSIRINPQEIEKIARRNE